MRPSSRRARRSSRCTSSGALSHVRTSRSTPIPTSSDCWRWTGTRASVLLKKADVDQRIRAATRGALERLASPEEMCPGTHPHGAPPRHRRCQRGSAARPGDANLVERVQGGHRLLYESAVADRLHAVATEVMMIQRRRDVRLAPSVAKRAAHARWARRLHLEPALSLACMVRHSECRRRDYPGFGQGCGGCCGAPGPHLHFQWHSAGVSAPPVRRPCGELRG